MNKIILLLFISFLSITLSAQSILYRFNIEKSKSLLHKSSFQREESKNINHHQSSLMKKDNFLKWLPTQVFTYNQFDTSRYTFSYDANGNMLSKLDEYWYNNTWVNLNKQTYTYDVKGNMLTFLNERWQINGWVNDYRDTYTYDANGNILIDLNEDWYINTWKNSYRHTFTYDANNNCLTFLTEDWQNNAWVNYFSDTYTHDANGNMLTWLSQEWQINGWVNDFRKTYTYANGKMLTFLNEDWLNNGWVNDFRETYTYNANGNMQNLLNEDWQDNSWVNDFRETYTYDANGNMLNLLNEDPHVNGWGNNFRNTYTYDANNNSITGKYEIWKNNEWTIDDWILDLYSNKQYVKSIFGHRYEATWNSFTGINELGNKNLTFKISPNPADETLVINVNNNKLSNIKAEITDISGKLILSFCLNNSKTSINTSSIKNGIYFIRLTVKDSISTEKLIINH